MKTFHFYGEKTFPKLELKNTIYPSSKRKVAISGILSEDNKLRIGIASCSEKDQFCKRTGRLISTGRAVKKPEKILKASKVNVAKQFIRWATKYCD